MGEALIPFYAMLDTRNAIWCPRSVWRRRNSMSEDGRMMLERVHACDETCYFIHKLGWDEEVCTGCLKSRFCKSFRHLSLLNILFIAFNLRIDVRFFSFFSTLCIYYHGEIEDERELVVEEGMISMISIREHVGKTWIGRRNERNILC